MPKSKVRGGRKAHRKRSQQRTTMIRNKKAKLEREFREMILNAQKEEQMNENSEVVNVDELELGLGDDLELDLDVDVEQTNEKNE
jgi:hypothetical protein